ncbi:fucoxanthin chl a/c light-harvesting protein [Thalassiosira pseudonana CCMP1335]|jgi:light-harvesting complex I chlorophyll a/b binding protein 1|uniref:Fucoxanthin chl a/c light-harvesting protein n=2 Tax=Thalassiosira pseudonana TaxID=35128 RepID=B8BYV4_THAPS|nr:fucoxanthin chl a/c light-harvesting protein [Thalassiosira pseudonana CCMP1335]EED93953.1 fucoxanthin chl a/c light-harvesting protein [Thalassiosira pseudonana CCMP1335]|mmetsp:Transcript_17853/g.38539  ORF Transcript_17853/g.38539 Transcript_17853/m.38539 type:complete len:215 (+) Transcript_17853:102-746(+)|eukprot:g2744.t1 g2744   contig12:715888-716532(-)
MMKIAALSLLAAGSASAFAPASNSVKSSALNAERSPSLPFMNKPALLDPSMPGYKGFDPLGLSNIDDVGIDLYWLREAEIKHARVAMLAVAGAVWVEAFGPAPGCEAATAKNQMDAFWQIWNSHPQYIAASLVFIMIAEAVSGISTTTGRESGEREPGFFGFGSNFPKTDADMKKMQDKELENGRLAMWAAMGLIFQGSANHMGGLEALGATFN